MRPGVARAAVSLLEAAGFDVRIPAGQTCCGQPARNAGDRTSAERIARHTIAVLVGDDPVVVPSASCAGMLIHHFPALLATDPVAVVAARALAARTVELTDFLHTHATQAPAVAGEGRSIAFHDSCSALRECGVSRQPRALLQAAGFETCDATDLETCCGFGGSFAVKFPEISASMGTRKLDALLATGATDIAACDMGCLMHLAGLALRRGDRLAFRHVAELLADGGQGPAIGTTGSGR